MTISKPMQEVVRGIVNLVTFLGSFLYFKGNIIALFVLCMLATVGIDCVVQGFFKINNDKH
jgi:hypothetical protein